MKYIAFAAAFAATPALADAALTINFAGAIAGNPLSCAETFEGIGAKASAVTGTDYRLSFPGDADCATVMTKLGLPYGDIPARVQQLVSKR